jgi:hypothetical protein
LVLASSPPEVGRDAYVSVVPDSPLQAQLRIELFQLVADRIEEVTRPLRDEAAASKLWVASAAGSWEHAEAASAGGVGRAPVRASDARLRDAELLEFVGSCLPIHRFYGSSPLVCLLLALMWGQTIIYLVMCLARSVAPVLCLFSQMHL